VAGLGRLRYRPHQGVIVTVDIEDLAALRPGLVHYATRHAPHGEAEDVTQDTLLAVWLAADRLDEHIRAFAYAVAARRCADAWRAAHRRPPTVAPFEDYAAELADTTPGPAERAQDDEDARQVAAVLAELATRDAAVVVLRLGHRVGATETGEMLGLTAGNVRLIQHRTLQALRRIYPCRDCGERPGRDGAVTHIPGCAYDWTARA
jgi:RNA polymerase sigma factor (sigma-70 family)